MSRLTRAVAVAVYACRLMPGSSWRRLRQLPVLGSKIVAPLADAVRLVYGDEADTARRQEREEPFAAFADQALRRDVQQAVASLSQPCDDRAFLGGGQRAVVQTCGYAVAHERVDLILHQRDERGDHHGEAWAHDRGRLKAERLAAAGRQHHQRVAAREHGLHGFALERPERRVTPVAGERVLEQGERVTADMIPRPVVQLAADRLGETRVGGGLH